MNETGRARFSRALRWLLAAVTLLLAALLIWQCAAAYLKGTSPANRTETGVLGKERCTVARRTVGSPQTVATLMTGHAMGDIVACHGRVYRLGKARDGGKQERHQQ